jgi:G-patch domain
MHRSMPVEEYGAALLRGMGWSGPDISNNTSDNLSVGTSG